MKKVASESTVECRSGSGWEEIRVASRIESSSSATDRSLEVTGTDGAGDGMLSIKGSASCPIHAGLSPSSRRRSRVLMMMFSREMLLSGVTEGAARRNEPPKVDVDGMP